LPDAATAPETRERLRHAMRLREAGDLAVAVESLRADDPLADPAAEVLRWKLLYELQDYPALQAGIDLVAAQPDRIAAIADVELSSELLKFAERCHARPAAIEACLNATKAICRRDRAAGATWRASNRRAKQRDAIRARRSRARFVSLGLNCLPWHLTGRWGLREVDDLVALLNPFSLAGHTIPGLIRALSSDFQEYCKVPEIRTIKTQRSHEFAMRTDREAFWNHHRGRFWLDNDCARLRGFLGDLAKRFRFAAQDPQAVFLLGTCPVEHPEERLDFLPALNDALSRHTGTVRNRLIITNQTARKKPWTLARIDAETWFAYCPYPSPDYVWHVEETANTDEGLEFERNYAKTLLRALIVWGLAERPSATDQGA
jgi:hypothetical protein